MVKSSIFHGGTLIGEAEIFPVMSDYATWNRDIRISHFSPPSERCPPLAVFHTIATGGVCFRVECELPSIPEDSPIYLMHNGCLREKKTAVMSLGDVEIHLVAMAHRKSFRNIACFWAFSIQRALYNSCLLLLNIRCLGIVFDLDETLIVANTSRSFEDKIDGLQRKINSETDPQRASIMLAEIKRYQDDRFILKQYTENDQIFDNGMLFKAQDEVVPPICEGQQAIRRPVIRLHEKDMILTRINPLIRDTSVLVRLRPGWGDLQSYLTAKGRKRFEVYVCTMAERDYALEMWRLLDPGSNLINSMQLLDRIVCVKSGLRKSLANVFQDGICHPKLALVIDDRLKVWDDVDQPRVHVVPAFAPYYAPQVETNNSVPVLCVARNVACNVRACFFKDFDEKLLPYISSVHYEDEILGFSPVPDVGTHLALEDDVFASNGSKDSLCINGLAVADAERSSKEFGPQSQVINNIDSRIVSSLPQTIAASSNLSPLPATLSVMPLPLHSSQMSQFAMTGKPLGHSVLPEPNIQGSPAREEGEVPESELDPDTRRRLLILQHGQDTRDNSANDTSLPGRPLQMPIPAVQSRGSWFSVDGELSPRQLDRIPKEFPFESGAPRFDRRRYTHPSVFRDTDRGRFNKAFHEGHRFSRKKYRGDDQIKARYPTASYEPFPGEEIPSSRSYSIYRSTHFDSEQVAEQYSGNSVEVLRDIATKCGTKVECTTYLGDSADLQFGIEVWFAGEKFAGVLGRTRKEAQLLASENSLKTLANRYISHPMFGSLPSRGDVDRISPMSSNVYASNSSYSTSRDDHPQQHQVLHSGSDEYTTASTSIATLKEHCKLQGIRLGFHAHPLVSTDSTSAGRVYAQVEISGDVVGRGSGATWEEAKIQAADDALANLNTSPSGQFIGKRSDSPRSSQTNTNKRLKADSPRSLQRIPSSRYSRSGMPVP